MRVPVSFRLLGLSLIAAGAIFAFDVLAGPHIAAEFAYVGVVLICLASTWPPFAMWLAALATCLVLGAYLAAPVPLSIPDLSERGLVLLVIWMTALLCVRLVRTANQLEQARAKLRRQNSKAETTAIQARMALRSERNDRVRIEEELEEAEHRYRGFFNQTFQLVAVLRPSGAVEEVNDTMREIASLPADAAARARIWDLPLWDAEASDRLRSAVATAASGDFFRDEFHVQRSGDDDMVVDLSLKPIRTPSGQVDLIICEARDITQHKRDQELLIQAQKMEILGQFASGIAHDFNNLLTVIAGNLELVQRRLKDDGAVAQRIGKAVTAAFQGRALTDRILAFARKQQLEPRTVDVHALMAEAVELSKSGLDENTSMESEIQPGLWACWADPLQLQSALLNLLINARDAMPDGGRISVRAYNFTLKPEHQEGRPDLKDGDYVVLAVQDDGEGIPAELLDKVTEPFFTTKEPGRGSGMGLSMVHGFAKQSGGDLEIASVEGRGTTIRLYLPRSLEAVDARPQRREGAGSGGEALVIVVEDEAKVRDAAVSMLSDLGYTVEEAPGGEQALALLRQGRHFDLLLTDIMMPGGKDGLQLGRQAKTILPDIKILYSSAHPEKAAEIRPAIGADEDFIPKPYRYAELAQKAEALLSDENEAR